MRILTIACFLALLGFVPASADDNRKFPYDAEIEADDLHVRSGPGTRYYPTGRLHAGQRVKVRRHDPGGWLMIDPPEGSFSLVPANVVEKNDDQTGAIAGENIKVIMGGVHNETQGVTQRELNQGDLVEILGEMELTIGGPLQKWYKIRPPQGEFRWVAGQYVRPVGQPRTVHKPNTAPKSNEPYNPFDEETPVPAKKSQPSPETARHDAARKQESGSHASLISRNGAIAQTGPTAEVLAAERERVRALDQQWELMVQREPQYWQIDQLEQAYRQLQSELTATVLQRQIDIRLGTLKEHRKIYGDLAEFNRIKEQTDLRDAQLRGAPLPRGANGEERFERPLMQAAVPNAPAAPNAPSTPNANGQPPANPIAPASANTNPANPSNVTPAGGTPSPPSGFIAQGRLLSASSQTGGRLFQPKMPQLMVVNPNNQVIAFLHATPNVNLTPYINRNVGIQGSRWNQPGVQYPVISVTQVVPLDQNDQPAAPQNAISQNPIAQNNLAQPVAAVQQQPATNNPNAAPPYSYGQTIQTTPAPGNIQNATWTQQNAAMQQPAMPPQGTTFSNNAMPQNNTGTTIVGLQQPAAGWRPMTAPQTQNYQQLQYQPQYQQSNQYQQMQYQQPQQPQQYQAGMPVYRNQTMTPSQPTQSMNPLPTVSLPFGFRPASNRQSNSQSYNGRPVYNGMNSNSMPINPLAN